jgi:hypothetical protein
MPNVAGTDKGTWLQVAVDPPLHTLAGDQIRIIQKQLLQIRDGNVIAVRDLGPPSVFDTTITENQTLSTAIYFRNTSMAGVALTLVDVQTTGNSVLATFSDSTSLETDLTTLQQDAASVNQNTDLCKQLLLAALISRQPNLNDANAISGSTISIDMAGSNPIVFTLVDNVGA